MPEETMFNLKCIYKASVKIGRIWWLSVWHGWLKEE